MNNNAFLYFTGWIAIKFCKDIHGSQTVNPIDFDGHWMFPSVEFGTDIHVPQGMCLSLDLNINL